MKEYKRRLRQTDGDIRAFCSDPTGQRRTITNTVGMSGGVSTASIAFACARQLVRGCRP